MQVSIILHIAFSSKLNILNYKLWNIFAYNIARFITLAICFKCLNRFSNFHYILCRNNLDNMWRKFELRKVSLSPMDIWMMVRMSLSITWRCICFGFFVYKVGWMVMQYKVFPTDALWSPKDGPTIWLWKEDGIGWPKLLVGVLNLILFCLIWGNDGLRASEKKGSLVAGFQNILSSGSLGCWMMIRILELWVLMWNTWRAF